MLSLFLRDVFDEILDLIESVSEGFPTYSFVMSIEISQINRHPSKANNLIDVNTIRSGAGNITV